MDFHHNLDHQEEGLEEGPRVEEGPNAEELALAAPSAYCAFSLAFQTAGEHCGRQEIFLSDSLSIPLLCGHQEALLVSPQLSSFNATGGTYSRIRTTDFEESCMDLMVAPCFPIRLPAWEAGTSSRVGPILPALR